MLIENLLKHVKVNLKGIYMKKERKNKEYN